MIKITNIEKSYDSISVVNIESFEIHKNELFFILGPSGCGKTTLLKIIAGLIQPNKGQILIEGFDQSKIDVSKRNINLMFQNYALFPHLNIFENIAFGLKNKKIESKVIKSKVEQSLKLFHIEKLKHRFPKSLSGGEQQRVALARAIVNEPKLLLLDEPLGALDEKLKDEMKKELRKLLKQLRLTCIYVTHDQEEALSMADRIAIMDQGSIIQIGTPKEIYYSPINKFVAEFIGEINFFNYNQKKIVNNKVVFQFDEGLEFNAKAKDGLNNSILAIRPEHILLQHTEKDCKLSGKIINKVFCGTYTQYEIETIINNNIKVNIQNSEMDKQIDLKTNVYLSWENNNLIEVEK